MRRRKAMLVLGILAVAAAPGAAFHDRRLITFQEAHKTVKDSASSVAKEALTNVVSPVASTAPSDVPSTYKGTTIQNPSMSISGTIKDAKVFVSAKAFESGRRRNTVIGHSNATGGAATPTSMVLPTEPSASVAAEAQAPDGATSQVMAKAVSQGTALNAREGLITAVPPALVAEPTVSTEPAPVADKLTSTNQSTSNPQRPFNNSIVSNIIDSSVTAEPGHTDAPVVSLKEGVAANSSTGILAQREPPATWPASSGSTSNNPPGALAAFIGFEANDKRLDPGQVRASLSIDERVAGSNAREGKSVTFDQGRHKKKHETAIHKTHDSIDDEHSRCCDTNKSTSSQGGKSDLGALDQPEGGVIDVNTSSATYESLNTGSIVAIVGVIGAIIGLVALFFVISRKQDTQDDTTSSLPYGYTMDLCSIVRLSPTFMNDDTFLEGGYNGTALEVTSASPRRYGSSSYSGETADELGSLPKVAMASDMVDVRVSAFYSSGSSMTSDSRISSSWSSVLASETDHEASRNTRDTTLSGWSASNLSNFGSMGSGTSGVSRVTRSSSGLSLDYAQFGYSNHNLSLTRLPKTPRVAPEHQDL